MLLRSPDSLLQVQDVTALHFPSSTPPTDVPAARKTSFKQKILNKLTVRFFASTPPPPSNLILSKIAAQSRQALLASSPLLRNQRARR